MTTNASPTRRPSIALYIIGASIGMSGGLAVLFITTFGLFVKPISADLEWSRAQTSLLVTMGFVGYSIGAPVLGLLYDRLGIRQLLGGAIIIFAAGLTGLGLVPPGPLTLSALCFVIGFSGAATAPSGYVLILAKVFELRLGLMIGLAMIGFCVGIVGAPILLQASIASFGWRHTYVLVGIVALTLGFAALFLGVGRVPDAPASGRQVQSDTANDGVSLGSALRSWRFWLLALTCTVVSAAGFGANVHLAAILSDRGLSAQTAAQAVGLVGAGFFVGRVGAAVLLDRIFAPLVAMGCCLVGATGLYMLSAFTAATPGLLMVAAMLKGVLSGSEGDTMPFLTRRYFGASGFGAIFGCVVGLAALGGIVGPVAFGRVFDAIGTYTPLLQGAAAVCVLCGLGILLLGPYRYPATRREPARS